MKKIEIKKPTVKVGLHKKRVVIFWVVLIGSIAFGVFNNITGVKTHTVTERTLVETKLIDTNSIENFVTDFASVFFSWDNNDDAIQKRSDELEKYLTDELHRLNKDTIKTDTPTKSQVNRVKVWNVEQNEKEYTVLLEVVQSITEGDQSKRVQSAYTVVVHVDNDGNMIIIKTPTADQLPSKSEYTPTVIESDSDIQASTIKEIEEFLQTFFTLYPRADAKELAYYVRGGALPVINQNYVFDSLIEVKYITSTVHDDGVICDATVKYLDQTSKVPVYAQYTFTLQKTDNWKIIA